MIEGVVLFNVRNEILNANIITPSIYILESNSSLKKKKNICNKYNFYTMLLKKKKLSKNCHL